MDRVFICGIMGNMGRRYEAICTYLGITAIGCDPYNRDAIKSGIPICDGVIIATPTSTHLQMLEEVLQFGKKVLCEKPFTKSLLELNKFHDRHDHVHHLITMVDQYKYLLSDDITTSGGSEYSYYKSGQDSIAWDCINIIGHSEGEVELRNTSPVWTCRINGQDLSIEQMDHAYIRMIEDWASDDHEGNYEYALRAHGKVAQFISEQET